MRQHAVRVVRGLCFAVWWQWMRARVGLRLGNHKFSPTYESDNYTQAYGTAKWYDSQVGLSFGVRTSTACAVNFWG